ncbi:TIGR01458 family HAD-type hydrolase [Teredinibacter turnerae]|uniref:TIGR01458 family HAD-type hydrolase n=1 Tax=Teredinibacter turnerae TaxID=2426 RepID=UPI0004200EC3|nr:TIGR01458 family HAD-type hydrolase [Teredinibacter turnerae]
MSRAAYRGIFFDLSGVIYDDRGLIDGAVEAIKHARDANLTLRFVTNTATKNATEILANLHAMGVDARPEELFTAPDAARSYIKQHQLHPLVLVHQAISADFQAYNAVDADCVLLGDARDDLSYANLNNAFRVCKAGAPLISIGMNKYFQTSEGLQLDAGAFAHALEWASGCDLVVMGKPSVDFFAEVVRSTGLEATNCLMVGDDVESDVLGAIEAGIAGCLVQTGKYRNGDETRLSPEAALVGSIAEVMGLISP